MISAPFCAISTSVLYRRFGREKFSAIGKRIGRDVEDAHDQRAIASGR